MRTGYVKDRVQAAISGLSIMSLFGSTDGNINWFEPLIRMDRSWMSCSRNGRTRQLRPYSFAGFSTNTADHLGGLSPTNSEATPPRIARWCWTSSMTRVSTLTIESSFHVSRRGSVSTLNPTEPEKHETFRLKSATHAIFGLVGPTLLQIHGVASDQPCQLVEKLSSRTNSNVLRQRISKVSHTSGMWRFARCRAGFETSVVTIVRLARSDSA